MSKIVKKIIATATAVLMLTATCTDTLANTNSPITLSVTASAATTALTSSNIDEFQRDWDKHPYVLMKFSANNKTSTGKKCVKDLQLMLNFTNNANLTIDSTFGNGTEKAVKNFQAKYGLSKDGIVGNGTWKKLISVARSKISSSKTSGVKLDLNRAREYAKAHWSKSRRNPHYNYYAGNNCANYVSQILEYAGLKTDSGWHNAKYNYINCGGLQNYLYKTYNVKYDRNLNIKAGDIIVTNGDLGHVMFVMQTKNGKIIANGNTNDRNQITVGKSIIYGVIHTSILFS